MLTMDPARVELYKKKLNNIKDLFTKLNSIVNNANVENKHPAHSIQSNATHPDVETPSEPSNVTAVTADLESVTQVMGVDLPIADSTFSERRLEAALNDDRIYTKNYLYYLYNDDDTCQPMDAMENARTDPTVVHLP